MDKKEEEEEKQKTFSSLRPECNPNNMIRSAQ